MEVHNIYDIEPMVFPTGRCTRVMVGERGLVRDDTFAEGLVEIQVGGSIPMHNHGTLEVYMILSGSGILSVDGEEMQVKTGDFVQLKPWQRHGLVNTGKDLMRMLFVYAPGQAVDHWDKEIKGEKLL